MIGRSAAFDAAAVGHQDDLRGEDIKEGLRVPGFDRALERLQYRPGLARGDHLPRAAGIDVLAGAVGDLADGRGALVDGGRDLVVADIEGLEHVTADQGHGAAQFRQLGGGLDSGRTRSDHRHRGRCRSGVDERPQPLRRLQAGDRVGELGRSGHARVGAGTSHCVDQVVVVDRAAGRQRHAALGSVDPCHGVDDQPNTLGQNVSVVDDRIVGPAHQLVQSDPLDEGRARVDQSHGHVVALRQAVGRHDAGVPAADHDDIGVLSHGVSFASGGSAMRHRPIDRCDTGETDTPPSSVRQDTFPIRRPASWPRERPDHPLP